MSVLFGDQAQEGWFLTLFFGWELSKSRYTRTASHHFRVQLRADSEKPTPISRVGPRIGQKHRATGLQWKTCGYIPNSHFFKYIFFLYFAFDTAPLARVVELLFPPNAPSFFAVPAALACRNGTTSVGRLDELPSVLRRMGSDPTDAPSTLHELLPGAMRYRGLSQGEGTHTVVDRLCADGEAENQSPLRWAAHAPPGHRHDGDAPGDGRGKRLTAASPRVGIRGLLSGRKGGVRRSLLVLMVVWFTISYGSYGVDTWNNVLFSDIGLPNPYVCSFIFALGGLPGSLWTIFMVEKVRMGGGMGDGVGTSRGVNSRWIMTREVATEQ